MTLNYCGLNDVYFKKLLKENKEVLPALLKGICGIDVDIDNIIFENIENIDEINLATTRYDIAIKIFNTRIDIESESSRHGDSNYYDNRKIYYLSRLHSSSYEKIDYNVTNKSYVIFLYNFDIGYKNLINESMLINKDEDYIYPNLRVYDVNLSKVDKSSTLEIERLLDLLRSKNIEKYLKSEDKLLKGVANMIQGFDEDELTRLRAQKRIDDEIEIRSMKAFARKEGLEEGLVEGRTEGILFAAKGMLNAGISIDKIVEATGLSEEEIIKLK